MYGCRGKFVEYWARGESGPVCFENEFDTKVYWKNLQKITKEFGIEYDPKHMVPCDDDMLDRLWQAAIKLVATCGILNVDTSRIIEFSEKEIQECIDYIPNSYTLGTGKDTVVFEHRGFEDWDKLKQPVFAMGRILGPISEDLYEKIAWSFAIEPYVDYMHFQGTLTHVNGVPVTPDSPWEMMAELKSVAIVKDVLRRACRPGLPDGGIRPISSTGQMSGYDPHWGTSAGDNRSALTIPHLKVNNDHLARAFYWHSHGMGIQSDMTSYVGGLSGGPATSAVTATAEFIINKLLFDATFDDSWSVDAMYFSNTSKYSLWCSNYSTAAVVRNTHCGALGGGGQQMTAGIGSEQFFWESAASAMSAIVLGCGIVGGTGCQSAGLDHCCGLGMRFSYECANAVARQRLTREQVNELVLGCMKHYQQYIDDHTAHKLGGDFRECYDLVTVQPKKEYLAMYEKVKAELRQMGLTELR
jgi:methylamine--corrinoid protein Co-methyltransferase